VIHLMVLYILQHLPWALENPEAIYFAWNGGSFVSKLTIFYRVNKKVTHLVASTSRTRTHKVRQAAKYPQIKIVSQQWLMNSMSKWEKEDEAPYLVSLLL
jgi:hypothetical protein